MKYKTYTKLPEFAKFLEYNYEKYETTVQFADYEIRVHHPDILRAVKEKYTKTELAKLDKLTAKARDIKTVKKPHGTFVNAATFESRTRANDERYNEVGFNPVWYSHIWVRDSIWCYYALEYTKPAEAKAVLLTQLDYLGSQVSRIQHILKNPKLANSSNSHMEVIHIRFDANSPEFKDAQVDGKDQEWGHKQNDALGLLLDATISAIRKKKITHEDLIKNQRLDGLVLLIAYFDKLKFWKMEDSGAWEEEQRLNTSSVGLVTSGLENLQNLFNENSDFMEFWQEKGRELKVCQYNTQKNLTKMINHGYKLVKKQIKLGGESPQYRKSNGKYREADAAMLSIIYPAKLSKLTYKEKCRVLSICEPLVGHHGVRRYFRDIYQEADFWFYHIEPNLDPDILAKREEKFIEHSEAQWFFDSWMAKCYLILNSENPNQKYIDKAFEHTNRSLGQFTGKDMYAANGAPAQAFALPESYNAIVWNDRYYRLPSPMLPLNWANASLELLFQEWKIQKY